MGIVVIRQKKINEIMNKERVYIWICIQFSFSFWLFAK